MFVVPFAFSDHRFDGLPSIPSYPRDRRTADTSEDLSDISSSASGTVFIHPDLPSHLDSSLLCVLDLLLPPVRNHFPSGLFVYRIQSMMVDDLISCNCISQGRIMIWNNPIREPSQEQISVDRQFQGYEYLRFRSHLSSTVQFRFRNHPFSGFGLWCVHRFGIFLILPLRSVIFMMVLL